MLQKSQANFTLLAFEKEMTEKIGLDILVNGFSERHCRLQLGWPLK